MPEVLRRLRIENLVLIREAELELAPGLNAITGETGAGKTILAQALGLLLGAKGDDSYVGAAGDEAYVEAELDLPDELEKLDELRPEGEARPPGCAAPKRRTDRECHAHRGSARGAARARRGHRRHGAWGGRGTPHRARAAPSRRRARRRHGRCRRSTRARRRGGRHRP